jgi:hypothetical protein
MEGFEVGEEVGVGVDWAWAVMAAARRIAATANRVQRGSVCMFVQISRHGIPLATVAQGNGWMNRNRLKM